MFAIFGHPGGMPAELPVVRTPVLAGQKRDLPRGFNGITLDFINEENLCDLDDASFVDVLGESFDDQG